MFIEMGQGSSSGGLTIDDMLGVCHASTFSTTSNTKYILCLDIKHRVSSASSFSAYVTNATDFEILGYADIGSSSRGYVIRFKATSSSVVVSDQVANTTCKLVKAP